MSESLSLIIPPAYIGGILGLAIYNLSMAFFHNIFVSLVILLIVAIGFPMVYQDTSPHCVYCYGYISVGAQFCPHCGRIQPESD